MQRLFKLSPRHASTLFVLPLLLAIAFPGTARAEPESDPPGPTLAKTQVFAGDNLSGLRGLARTVAATNNAAGYISLGTNLEFFSSSGFIRDGSSTTLYDHSRFDNTYTVAFAPLRFMEVSFGLHVISDNTTGTGGNLAARNDGLQVAI
ncbi:MAG: hypothetical protein KAI47_27590, partial [Deltaproteobacteria bacterium]|nr:hypothetical protein [Deltaproteobacteria bacterium]